MASIDASHYPLPKHERARSAGHRDSEALLHDLLGALGTISGEAELLQRRSRSGRVDPRNLESALGGIARQARSLGDQLRLALEVETPGRACALRSCVANALATLSEEQRRRVRVSIPDGLPQGTWDEWLLTSVIRNLVENGLRYSPAPAPVVVTAGSDGLVASIAVEDRGIGLDATEMTSLFGRGYRSPRARGMAAGLGLGLSTCRRAVEAMGGRIIAASAGSGMGAVFTVILPLAGEGTAECQGVDEASNTLSSAGGDRGA